MTSTSASHLVPFLRIASPAILIAIGFLWFCWLPTQKQIQTRRAELEKNQGIASASPATRQSTHAKLASIQTELAAIAVESDQIRAQLQSLAPVPTNRSNASARGHSSAKAVASTLELLRHNRMVCIESGWIARPTSTDERLISTSIKAPSTSAAEMVQRSRASYRIRMHGRFEDVRLSLVEMHEQLPNVLAISIDMELPHPMSEQRTWTLTILP